MLSKIIHCVMKGVNRDQPQEYPEDGRTSKDFKVAILSILKIIKKTCSQSRKRWKF